MTRSEFRAVIPKRVREQFGLSPGQTLQVIALPGRIALVPAITIFVVFKWVLREHGEAQAVQAAAQLSQALQLPMAESIIMAMARDQQARLYTMLSDFRGIADVEWLGSK